MEAQFPGVAVGFDLLGPAGEVFVFVFHVAALDAGLEVARVLDAIRRVDVNHLDLAGHAFFDQKRVHYQQRVAHDQAVGSADLVLGESDLLVGRQWRFAEKIGLHRLRALNCPQDRFGRHPLVDEERDHVHLKGRVLGLTDPDELRPDGGS